MQRVTVTLGAAALRNGTVLGPVLNASGIVSTSTSSLPPVESLVAASVAACGSSPTDVTTAIAATRAATTGDLTTACIRPCQKSSATLSVRRARSCSGHSDRITDSAQTAAGGLAHVNVDLPSRLRPFLPEEKTRKNGLFWRSRFSWTRLPAKSTRICWMASSVTVMLVAGKAPSVASYAMPHRGSCHLGSRPIGPGWPNETDNQS